MVSQALMSAAVDGIVVFAKNLLLPMMVGVFFLGVALRTLIHFTVSRELWFSKEFEKRINNFLEIGDPVPNLSFFAITKQLLEKTYYELFVVRAILQRRKPDAVQKLTDRLFLIQHGCARLVKTTLKHIKFLKYDGKDPGLLAISKAVFEHNPCFSRVFGVIPVSSFNEMLNLLPGLFIVGGIFGTFLGIMNALPELSNMNLNDTEGTKAIMDTFLLKVSFSMSTSVMGILLSVMMTVLNAFMSPERIFVQTVNRFENSLSVLWNASRNNDLPKDMQDFDEHKDPIVALAADAVTKEADKKVMFIKQAG